MKLGSRNLRPNQVGLASRIDTVDRKNVLGEIDAEGKLFASGYTRFLETGEYSYTGEVELQTPDNSSLIYTALAVGTWKVVEDWFVITAFDIRSAPRALKQRGRPEVDLTSPTSIPRQLLPRLEDFMPRGASQEYSILELSSTRLQARSIDLRGTPVTYEATRQ